MPVRRKPQLQWLRRLPNYTSSYFPAQNLVWFSDTSHQRACTLFSPLLTDNIMKSPSWQIGQNEILNRVAYVRMCQNVNVLTPRLYTIHDGCWLLQRVWTSLTSLITVFCCSRMNNNGCWSLQVICNAFYRCGKRCWYVQCLDSFARSVQLFASLDSVAIVQLTLEYLIRYTTVIKANDIVCPVNLVPMLIV